MIQIYAVIYVYFVVLVAGILWEHPEPKMNIFYDEPAKLWTESPPGNS